MKEKHIVLRSIGVSAATRDRSFGPLGSPTGLTEVPAGLSVDVDELDKRGLSAVTREREVVAVAPVVPMKLIAPRDVQAAAQPAAPMIAWGVQAVGADTCPFSGKGVTVAVLDTGIDKKHPAFAGVTLVEKDFTGEGNGDQHGHGTHCAGTILGRNISNTRIGVAPGVKKALIGKVLGQQGGASDGIVSAIQWAVENGANVISMSLGIDFPGLVKLLQDRGLPAELAASRALEGYRLNVQLFERVASLVRAMAVFAQPTLIIAAAGNESERDQNPDFEIAVSPPAVSEGVVSVAALGQGPQGLAVAPFSNTGANIAGPGVAITSAKPGGGLQNMSGTSMATPHVAGVAALWAEKVKDAGQLTMPTLLARLIGSATTQGLKQPFDPTDVGAGLVRSPQN